MAKDKIAGKEFWDKFRNALIKAKYPRGKSGPSFSQSKLAEMAGVKLTVIHRALKGKKVSAENYYKIVKNLKLSV